MRKRWFYIVYVLMFFLAPLVGVAQTQPNPFELKQRIKLIVKDTLESGSTNPFDINRKGAISKDEHVVDFNNPSFLKKGWKVGDSIFWVMLFLLFFLAGLMPLGRSSITAFLKGLTGASPFNVLYRNYSSFFSPLGMALYLFYFINMGLFIYLLSQEYGFVKGESLRNLFILILFVSTLFWLKQIVIRVLGGIFPIQKEVAKYSFLIGVLSSLLGLFLFPINLVLVYGSDAIRLPTLYIAVTSIGLVFIYKYIVGVSTASRQVIRNKYNFFMYLCTLEIAPALVLGKFLLSYQGLEILH